MIYEVIISVDTDADLDEIIHYYASVENIDYGIKLVDSIYARINKLDKNPKQYPFYDKDFIKSKDVRFVIYKKYLIFFRVIDEIVEHGNHIKEVHVIRVIYGRRDLENELKGM